MNRKQLITYCNEMVFPLFKPGQLSLTAMVEILKTISIWRKGKSADIQMVATIDTENNLYINGDCLGDFTGIEDEDFDPWKFLVSAMNEL